MPFPNPDTQFSKGQSGNPSGRPSKARLTEALLKLLDDESLDGRFVKAGMNAALAGDFAFWKYIFDRIDGPIKADDDTSESKFIEAVREASRAIDRSQGSPEEPVDPVS